MGYGGLHLCLQVRRIYREYSAQMTTLLTLILDTYVWSNYSDVTRVLAPKRKLWKGNGTPYFRNIQGGWNIIIWPDMYTHTLKSPKIQVAIWEQHKWWNEMKGCNFLCKYVLCVYDVILDAFLISITVRLFIACLLQTFSYVVSMPRTAYTRCKLY